MADRPAAVKRRKIKEPPEAAELREAFETWAAEHGFIWFDNDVRLARAIAKVLNIDLVWGDDVRKGRPVADRPVTDARTEETCAQDQHEYEWIVPLGYLSDGDLVARCRKCGAELVAVMADRPVTDTKTEPHPGGVVLADRGDGLRWLRCWLCGRKWAEKESGAYAKGSRRCAGSPRG